MWPSSNRYFSCYRWCCPMIWFKIQVDYSWTINFFLWMIWCVHVSTSTVDIHSVFYHSCSIYMKKMLIHRTCTKIIDLNLRKSRNEGGAPDVWIKCHCIVCKLRQWTSHENWSINSSKPPKMNIKWSFLQAECPSRAPGKFPLVDGVLHSSVLVSKLNKISQTYWREN